MWLTLWTLACSGPVDTGGVDTDAPHTDIADTEPAAEVRFQPLRVVVTVDGSPTADVVVSQGGVGPIGTTGADGGVDVVIDRAIEGDKAVIAAHPSARQRGEIVRVGATTVTVALERYDPVDNEAYDFMPAGTPFDDDNSLYCSHCHKSQTRDWYDSPHRSAASNPYLYDLYSGTAGGLSAAACATVGGEMAVGPLPGGGEGERCALGDGVLDTTKPDCAPGTCDDPLAYGGCADCHAPGINGKLGGRDLHEAEGVAFEAGVHCDVCHHVDAVDLESPLGGVAGRLKILRPSEPASIVGIGEFLPLVFGPWYDSPNIRMGSVQRDLFATAQICGGCHQQAHAPLVPGVAADASRWPDGRLPIDTTFEEWQTGPLGEAGVPCNACHMPPDPEAGNGIDIQLLGIDPGYAGGWWRAPGAVHEHAWFGPRQPDSGLPALAAWVDVDATVADGAVTAAVTVENVGCAHAIPGGIPLRQAILVVEATCDGVPLAPIGGDAIDELGGWSDRLEAGDDWSVWPGAAVGDTLRVVRRTGLWRDDPGWGPFGDGTFTDEAKGLPEEVVVGAARVTAVASGRVTTDRPLPAGDVVYRVTGAAYAGAPGRLFERVTVGADGTRGVPDHLAVDIASDNRLLPDVAVTTTHVFASPCAAPEVEAVLWWRRWPMRIAAQRGWPVDDLALARGASR